MPGPPGTASYTWKKPLVKVVKIKFDKDIIYKNNNYLVVNKPAGVSVLADRSGEKGLLEIMKRKFPDIQVCHRIDKETSGALLFALNPDAYRHASIQFQNREVRKIYHALVNGRPEFRNYKEKRKILTIDDKSFISGDGKDSLTIFNTIEIFKKHTLVECILKTGRMHQIRVHLSANECPIIADELYGGDPFYLSTIKKNYNIGKYDEEKPLLGRLGLHARKLSFKDLNGELITAEVPYPKDIAASLNQLRKYSY